MRKKGKGQLLILVLAVMGMGMITIGPLLAYVDLSLRLSGDARTRNSAYYAAESGIQLVIADLYLAENPIEKSPYTGTMNKYNFSCTATNSSGNASQITARDVYVDPGVTMYMRPMVPAGCSCRFNSCADWHECYPFVVTKGKALKINWAGYTSSANRQPYDFDVADIEELNVGIRLYNESGEIAYKTPTPEELYASNEARIIANTLYIPGEDISGGNYIVRFENRATSGGANCHTTSQFFSDDYDESYYTFNGSITENCNHFINSSGGRNYLNLMVINEDNGDATGGFFGYGRQLNTFSFFCDYVSVGITSNESGELVTSTYTYDKGNESAMSRNKSFAGYTTVGSGSEQGMPGSTIYHYNYTTYGGGYYPYNNNDTYATNINTMIPTVGSWTELDAGNYSRIAAPDGDRMLATYDPRPSGFNNSFMMHVFDIQEDPGTVTRIDMHWEGYQTKVASRHTWFGDDDNRDNDELYLLIWNEMGTPWDNTDDIYHILAKKQVDAGSTWVKVEAAGYADYLLTSNASKDGEKAITITAYIRQAPGPSLWWEEQSLEILSWNVHTW